MTEYFSEVEQEEIFMLCFPVPPKQKLSDLFLPPSEAYRRKPSA